MENRLLTALYLAQFIQLIAGDLTIESCVTIDSLNNLDTNPSVTTLAVWLDNEKENEQIISVTGDTSSIGETLCWDYSSSNVETTGFSPDFARRVQFTLNNKVSDGYLVYDFMFDLTGTGEKSTFTQVNTQSLVSNGGTITFEVFHRFKVGTGSGFLKISNRNHLMYRDCYQLYRLCFYESGASSSCIQESGVVASASPENGGRTNVEADDTNRWPASTTSGEDCWEPYGQNIVIDLSQINDFASLGLGIYSSNGITTSSEYQDDGKYPKYFSFGFADDNYADDTAWQYWVIDLSGTTYETEDSNEYLYIINPLWLIRDTQPEEDVTRFNAITSGVPEIYSIDASLTYHDDSDRSTFNTWTVWLRKMSDPPGPANDNTDEFMGELATVACVGLFGTNYTGVASDLDLDLGDGECWGEAVPTPCPTVYGPPMRIYSLLTSETTISSYCNGATGKTSLVECVHGLGVNDCGGAVDCGVKDYEESMVASFSCQLDDVVQETSLGPSPNPTIAPSDSPSLSPTEAPTSAPIPVPPSANPTAYPTLAPTNAPSATPTATPTTAPTSVPTLPSATPSTMPSKSPVEPGNIVITSTSPPFDATSDAEAVGGQSDEEGDALAELFSTYLWYIIAGTGVLLLCCICLLVFVFKSRKDKSKKEKEPRNFGDAKMVELQAGLPRPLSMSDELKAERLKPDILPKDDLVSDDEDGLYGTSTQTGGTIGGAEGEGGRAVGRDDDLEGGDPAVTGQPDGTPGTSLTSPVRQPVRSSVASDASDVFSSPEESAMRGQFHHTNAGPDQALDLLVRGGGGEGSDIQHRQPQIMSVASHSVASYADDDLVLGGSMTTPGHLTQLAEESDEGTPRAAAGDTHAANFGNYSFGNRNNANIASIASNPSNGSYGSGGSRASAAMAQYHDLGQMSPGQMSPGQMPQNVGLVYGGNSNGPGGGHGRISVQSHVSRQSDATAISAKSDTLLGMADDGEIERTSSNQL